MRKNSNKGMSLVEILTTLAIFSLIVVITSIFYVNALRTYNEEFVETDLRTNTQTAIGRVANDIKRATGCLENYDIYSATTTPESLLILKVPGIDSGGNTIYTGGEIIVFDYIIYRFDGNNLIRIVLPDASSNRQSENGVILTNIISGSFSYKPVNPPVTWAEINEVNISISVSKVVRGKTITISLDSSNKLRNK